MTDNEIIKALECCVNDICEECPYREDECFDNLTEENKMLKDTLNLINRQKAEIERLKKNLNDVSKCNINLMYRMDNAKSEARKEFAEKVKEYFNPDSSYDFFKWLDNLLKEKECELNGYQRCFGTGI